MTDDVAPMRAIVEFNGDAWEVKIDGVSWGRHYLQAHATTFAMLLFQQELISQVRLPSGVVVK
jgi:hypothetical protein